MTEPRLPFDIDWMVEQIRQAVQDLPKAALFELYEEGFTSLFEQLIACIISIRTLDEVTLPVSRALFAAARSPSEVLALTPAQIEDLIRSSTFHERKAAQIHAIAARAQSEFAGELPCQLDLLLSFSGVGPKCAHLALGIACGLPRVSADIHVHRVTNRWGYISTRTPEQSGLALEAVLPERYWIEINRLLVPFGKHICTGPRPKCSTCPVQRMCRQVGVVPPAPL